MAKPKKTSCPGDGAGYVNTKEEVQNCVGMYT